MLAIIHGCKKMNLRTEACFPGQELQAELTSCWWWPVRDPVVSIWRPDAPRQLRAAPRQLRAGPDRAKSNHRNSEERTGTWANEQRKNVVHRLKETATKTTRTRMKLNESLSNLAERITTELRSYPEKIIAQFQLKLWEIPISCKNTAFLPKTKSAWNLMHEWNWWISIGRIVHHSSEHQSSQTKMLQSIRTNRSNIRAKKRKTRRTHTGTRAHQKWFKLPKPGGHGEVRASLPSQKLRLHRSIRGSSVDLSLKNSQEKETLARRGKTKNGRGEGDGGSLILFNRAITHFQFCSWI